MGDQVGSRSEREGARQDMEALQDDVQRAIRGDSNAITALFGQDAGRVARAQGSTVNQVGRDAARGLARRLRDADNRGARRLVDRVANHDQAFVNSLRESGLATGRGTASGRQRADRIMGGAPGRGRRRLTVRR